MKTSSPSFLYKQKFNKKLKKLIYCDKANNKLSNKIINIYNNGENEIMPHLDTDQNINKQNSVIPKNDIEKFLLNNKNSFITIKNSFNINNSEENSTLTSQFREAKENIPFNGFCRGLLSTKSKKNESSLNKNIKKRELYHNNSCIKKINLRSVENFKIENNKPIAIQQNNLGSKNKDVLKNVSNSKYRIKINKNIKSFGLLPIEENKNSLLKVINNKKKNNVYSNSNLVRNYYSQNITALSNNFLNRDVFKLKSSKKINNDFSKENVFIYNDEKQIELTKEEKSLYGDRIMKGYSKIKLLGKGGYGIVWLCMKNILEYDNDIKEYAIKQTTKKKNQESTHNLNNTLINARNEIAVLHLLNNKKLENENDNELNDSNNDNNKDKSNCCEIIPKIYDSYEDNNDIWFSFEKGGISLSSLCFKIKGEFEKGERIYLIQKGEFLENLFSNIKQFKYLLKQLVIGINYINSKEIIHSDIKPENILIDYTNRLHYFKINSIKIIDYGSSFLYKDISSSNASNTPEYLCPEITIGNKKFIKDLTKSNKYISAVDIWSLGITFLELCLCCPIWMNFKTKIAMKGKNIYTHGIFGCRMRDSNKIYQKQIEVSKNLKKLLNNSLLYMFEKEERDNFIDLLGKMLNIDYNKRINSQDILKHPFLAENIE